MFNLLQHADSDNNTLQAVFGKGTIGITYGVNEKTGNPIVALTHLESPAEIGVPIGQSDPENVLILLEFENEKGLNALRMALDEAGRLFTKTNLKGD